MRRSSRFILPAAYFVARGKVGAKDKLKLLAIAGGIGFQGFLGWYMVKSGLEDGILTTPGAVPRVSQYRLAAHLSAALLLYIGMLHTAIGISRDWKVAHGTKDVSKLLNPASRRFGKLATVIGAMVLLTASSGAFVAGLDAGLIYNEFPTMGGRIVPPADELLDDRYAQASDKSDKVWRNMLENPTTVQFDHRALAITTFCAVLALPFIATRSAVRRQLPKTTVRNAKLAAAAAIGQVTLGISTLIYLVPVPLAAAHQAGSVVLLTAMLALAGSLRRPSTTALMWRNWQASRSAAASSGAGRAAAGVIDSSIKTRVNVP